MEQRYVPLEKQSKRAQKEYHATRRGSWGGLNPVTRKPPNPKAYNRKEKTGKQISLICFPVFSICAMRSGS